MEYNRIERLRAEDNVLGRFLHSRCVRTLSDSGTFNRAFESWKGNYIYLTELVLVLNHKIWQWFGVDQDKATLYNELWAKADEYASDNLKDEEFSYFWECTD